MKDALTPRTVSESCVTTTELVLPCHTNQLGTIFGGQLMAWIDMAGSIAAARHARGVCVTASIDALHFVAPVRIGQHVLIQCARELDRPHLDRGRRAARYRGPAHRPAQARRDGLPDLRRDRRARQAAPGRPGHPRDTDELRRYHAAELRRASRLELKDKLEQEGSRQRRERSGAQQAHSCPFAGLQFAAPRPTRTRRGR